MRLRSQTIKIGLTVIGGLVSKVSLIGKIAKLEDTEFFICAYIPHDQVWSSPKEEKLILELLEKSKNYDKAIEALQYIARSTDMGGYVLEEAAYTARKTLDDLEETYKKYSWELKDE